MVGSFDQATVDDVRQQMPEAIASPGVDGLLVARPGLAREMIDDAGLRHTPTTATTSTATPQPAPTTATTATGPAPASAARSTPRYTG